MYEVFFASLRSPHWLTEILSIVFSDSTGSDVFNTDRHCHWATPPTFTYERVTYAPYCPIIQRIDHGKADRIPGSRSASGTSGQLRSFRLRVGIWMWVGSARVC